MDLYPTRRSADPREIEAHFQRVVEQLPVIVYIEAEAEPGQPGALLYASPQVETVLGMTAKEFIDDPVAWAELIHPDDRERVQAESERATRDDIPFDVEFRMLARDGRIVWFRDEAVRVHDEDGRPLHWLGTLTVITERKEQEERRRETEERYRTVVEQLPAVVYREDVTADGVDVIYVSPYIEHLMGYTTKEWLADPDIWFDSILPEDRERVETENERTELTLEPFSVEYRMRARGGRVVWVRDEAHVIRGREGEAIHWQGVMVEVTQQKRAEELERELLAEQQASEVLREADEFKDTMLRAVSHDLRTPLAAILGIASTLARPDLVLPREESLELAARIAVNARRLDRMVTDMLDLDRMARGALAPAFAPVDVGHLVREIVAVSDLVAGRRLQLDTAPIIVPADAAMVERIVENLLGNSAKHTPGDSRIWVRVERTDGGVLIVVEDDGPGIPIEDRQRIFETFAHGAPAQGAIPVRSTGVGLAVVLRFAELHGGMAWVEDRPGGGASFHVTLSDDPIGSMALEFGGGDELQPTAAVASSSEASQA